MGRHNGGTKGIRGGRQEEGIEKRRGGRYCMASTLHVGGGGMK